MKIIQHHHIGNDLQRSDCTESGRVVRRIARFVEPAGELCTAIPDCAVWQERKDDGRFHNTTGSVSIMLEKNFITALILANAVDPLPGDPIPEQCNFGSRYFLTENEDRVYHFPAGKRGTAWFPNRETHREHGTREFWSFEEMTEADCREISFQDARSIVKHIPA